MDILALNIKVLPQKKRQMPIWGTLLLYRSKKKKKIKRIQLPRRHRIHINSIRIDGSFDPSIGKYAFGCILLTPDGEIIRESGNGQDPESLAIRNVAGEMLGAMYAVQWAINHGYPSLTIYYDYEGIAKWAQGRLESKK